MGEELGEAEIEGVMKLGEAEMRLLRLGENESELQEGFIM